MSLDPDFHQAADAWLDAGRETGEGRILLDILNDSPAAAREFAALARVRAALEALPFSEEERLQRAAKLLTIPLRRKLRFLPMKPAVRWSAAAAALLAGSVIWLSAGSAGPPKLAKSRHSIPAWESLSPLSGLPTARAQESSAPADQEYVKRMESLIIPDFEAVDLSLEEAVSLLTGKTAAVDSTALTVAILEPEEGLPDERVHLRLKYQTVSNLLKLIALQTGMKVHPSARTFQLSVDPKSGAAGVEYRLVKLERWDSFLQSQGLMTSASSRPKVPAGVIVGHESGRGLEPPPPAAEIADNATPDLESFRMALLGTVHEAPNSVEMREDEGTSKSDLSLRVGSSEKLNSMLELLLAGPEAPGLLSFDMQWVTFESHAAVERMFDSNRKPEETAGIGGPALWSEENLPRLQAFLADDPAVKIKASPRLRIGPGGEGDMRIGTIQKSMDDPPPGPGDEGNWTGQHWTILSNPAGGSTTISLQIESHLPAENGGVMTQTLSNKLTLEVGSTFAIGGMIDDEGEHMVIVTARRPDVILYGILVNDQPGYVRSPYALDRGLVDVTGIPQGVKVLCPYTNQVFRIP